MFVYIDIRVYSMVMTFTVSYSLYTKPIAFAHLWEAYIYSRVKTEKTNYITI